MFDMMPGRVDWLIDYCPFFLAFFLGCEDDPVELNNLRLVVCGCEISCQFICIGYEVSQ